MTNLLIVDDNPVDQRVVAALLAEQDMALSFANDGQEAVDAIEVQPPDLVLTDMHMPVMNGLELVKHMREHHPSLPVILFTAKGSEELAVEALKAGASSYVPKRHLAGSLVSTIQHILAVAHAQRDLEHILAWQQHRECAFVFGCEFRHADALIGYLESQMREMGLEDEGDLLRVGISLQEALANAMDHGTLELSSDLREADGGYQHLAEERRGQPPYRDRRVHVTARLTRRQATFHIRDEGPGFDVASLPDPTDPENLEKVSGRGLLLIRSFMDQVFFNAKGNEITLIKQHVGPAETDMADEPSSDEAWQLGPADAVVQVEVLDSVLVVSPNTDLGELDYRSLEQALWPLLDVLENSQGINVLLDFAGTNYFSSSALALFLQLSRRVRDHGGKFALANLSETQQSILKTTALDKVWPLFGSREEALAFFLT